MKIDKGRDNKRKSKDESEREERKRRINGGGVKERETNGEGMEFPPFINGHKKRKTDTSNKSVELDRRHKNDISNIKEPNKEEKGIVNNENTEINEKGYISTRTSNYQFSKSVKKIEKKTNKDKEKEKEKERDGINEIAQKTRSEQEKVETDDTDDDVQGDEMKKKVDKKSNTNGNIRTESSSVKFGKHTNVHEQNEKIETLEDILGHSEIYIKKLLAAKRGGNGNKNTINGKKCETVINEQPKILKGILKSYQLEGLRFLVNLYNNGLNGILADEMGLGKTFQTISLLAYLKESKNVKGPHLILAPKSTVGNWINEIKKFCPDLNAFKFLGTKKERKHMIKKEILTFNHDIIVTSYEMCVKTKNELSKYNWEYLIIDEAHRIKNEASKLSFIVRGFKTNYRLLLTGTPLQNNLKELWALLNFLFPDVFSSAQEFEQIFDLTGKNRKIEEREKEKNKDKDKDKNEDKDHDKDYDNDYDKDYDKDLGKDQENKLEAMNKEQHKKEDIGEKQPENELTKGQEQEQEKEQKQEKIEKIEKIETIENIEQGESLQTQKTEEEETRSASITPTTQEQENAEIFRELHKILRPFLLRRMKKDVLRNMPEKKEIILYIKMSEMQKKLYKHLLSKNVDLVKWNEKSKGVKTRLLNLSMQLRKCCNHPYLFEGYEDEDLEDYGEHLVTSSGKMIVVDKLLKRLFDLKSRVLIFSQMTRMIDILEDYCRMRKYEYCRIDGSTNSGERDLQIKQFNNDKNIYIFLLSTRSGGLGINLHTADSVILFDSDWNPQVDLQAMDRAHRIGQEKEVNVYRLIHEHTIEEKILEKAYIKLKLDSAVIQQGRLSESDKKISSAELLSFIEYGADHIFKTNEENITEEDIDAILNRGKLKTKEFNDKIQFYNKKSCLDFSVEVKNVYEYEGVNYEKEHKKGKKKELEEQNTKGEIMGNDSFFEERGKADGAKGVSISDSANSNEVTKDWVELAEEYRKQNERPLNETNQEGKNEHSRNGCDAQSNELGIFKRPKRNLKKKTHGMYVDYQYLTRNVKIKKVEKLPAMKDYQFYNRDVINQIHKKQLSYYQSKGITERPTEEEIELKTKLLNEGFPLITKRIFLKFIKANELFGRGNIEKIAYYVKMDANYIRRYSKQFWLNYSILKNYQKIIRRIELGEKKAKKNVEHTKLLNAASVKLKNPFNSFHTLINSYQNKQKTFNSLEDDYILGLANMLGVHKMDVLTAFLKKNPVFNFDWYIQTRTPADLEKRMDTLLKALKKSTLSSKKKSGALANEVVVVEKGGEGEGEGNIVEDKTVEDKIGKNNTGEGNIGEDNVREGENESRKIKKERDREEDREEDRDEDRDIGKQKASERETEEGEADNRRTVKTEKTNGNQNIDGLMEPVL